MYEITVIRKEKIRCVTLREAERKLLEQFKANADNPNVTVYGIQDKSYKHDENGYPIGLNIDNNLRKFMEHTEHNYVYVNGELDYGDYGNMYTD